jgi:hypothetical protein
MNKSFQKKQAVTFLPKEEGAKFRCLFLFVVGFRSSTHQHTRSLHPFHFILAWCIAIFRPVNPSHVKFSLIYTSSFCPAAYSAYSPHNRKTEEQCEPSNDRPTAIYNPNIKVHGNLFSSLLLCL